MDTYDTEIQMQGSYLAVEKEASESHTEKRQEQGDQIMSSREARRLESDLRRRESEVANLERRIKASKENLRYVPFQCVQQGCCAWGPPHH